MSEGQPNPKEALYTMNSICPLCTTEFEHFAVRKSALRIQKRDSDFHTWTEGPNPDHYAIVVCPNCWYAAFAADFDELRTRQQQQQLASLPNLRKEMETRYQGDEFSRPRSPATAQLSLTLAVHWYRLRHASANRLAEIWLRLAWLERELGQEERERSLLEKARDLLAEAYKQSDLDDPAAVVRIAYLVFDLSIRLDDLETAYTWHAVLLKQRDVEIGNHLKNLIKERSLHLQSLRRERKERVVTAT